MHTHPTPTHPPERDRLHEALPSSSLVSGPFPRAGGGVGGARVPIGRRRDVHSPEATRAHHFSRVKHQHDTPPPESQPTPAAVRRPPSAVGPTPRLSSRAPLPPPPPSRSWSFGRRTSLASVVRPSRHWHLTLRSTRRWPWRRREPEKHFSSLGRALPPTDDPRPHATPRRRQPVDTPKLPVPSRSPTGDVDLA